MKTSLIQRTIREERASAAVEFAVILPVLMMFLFGIVEFGRVLSVSQLLATAAREGARAASLPGADNTTVLNAITNQLAYAGLSYDNVVLEPSDISTAARDQAITVTVGVTYNNISWVPGFFPALDSVELEKSVVMRKEGF